MTEEKQKLFDTCHLCRELEGAERNALRSIATIRTVGKGALLFLEGDRANGFYILLKGRIRVFKSSPDGREYTLHWISPGQMFAEAAIFRGQTFPANAAALSDSVVAYFPKNRFVDFILASPEVSLKMIGALSAFIREFNQKVEDLSLKETPSRLAAYLTQQAAQAGSLTFSLETSKTELASKLGTVSETLSRNLRKLRELGVITVSGRRITILDYDRLELIAAGEKV